LKIIQECGDICYIGMLRRAILMGRFCEIRGEMEIEKIQ
jgi:hypothetical protein